MTESIIDSTDQPHPGGRVAAVPMNVLAIVSFVSAFFISVVAVVCGHIALSQIKRTDESGRGLAIAGVILGYVGIGLGVIGVLGWALFAVSSTGGR